MTPPQLPDDDLAWLAFRYVVGELDSEESAAFEDRLDRDQSAREAVAGAVALVEGVVHATPARRSSPRVRRVAMAALAAAACLALAVAPRLFPLRPHRPATDVHTPAAGAGAAVALAWSGVLEQDAAEAPRPDDPSAALDDPEAVEVAPIETMADAGDRVEGLPGWLIEAASLRPSS